MVEESDAGSEDDDPVLFFVRRLFDGALIPFL